MRRKHEEEGGRKNRGEKERLEVRELMMKQRKSKKKRQDDKLTALFFSRLHSEFFQSQ